MGCFGTRNCTEWRHENLNASRDTYDHRHVRGVPCQQARERFERVNLGGKTRRLELC